MVTARSFTSLERTQIAAATNNDNLVSSLGLQNTNPNTNPQVVDLQIYSPADAGFQREALLHSAPNAAGANTNAAIRNALQALGLNLSSLPAGYDVRQLLTHYTAAATAGHLPATLDGQLSNDLLSRRLEGFMSAWRNADYYSRRIDANHDNVLQANEINTYHSRHNEVSLDSINSNIASFLLFVRYANNDTNISSTARLLEAAQNDATQRANTVSTPPARPVQGWSNLAVGVLTFVAGAAVAGAVAYFFGIRPARVEAAAARAEIPRARAAGREAMLVRVQNWLLGRNDQGQMPTAENPAVEAPSRALSDALDRRTGAVTADVNRRVASARVAGEATGRADGLAAAAEARRAEYQRIVQENPAAIARLEMERSVEGTTAQRQSEIDAQISLLNARLIDARDVLGTSTNSGDLTRVGDFPNPGATNPIIPTVTAATPASAALEPTQAAPATTGPATAAARPAANPAPARPAARAQPAPAAARAATSGATPPPLTPEQLSRGPQRARAPEAIIPSTPPAAPAAPRGGANNGSN